MVLTPKPISGLYPPTWRAEFVKRTHMPSFTKHDANKMLWATFSLTVAQRYDLIQLECTWDLRVPRERPHQELRNEPPLDMSLG